jgi:hypothetical protein
MGARYAGASISVPTSMVCGIERREMTKQKTKTLTEMAAEVASMVGSYGGFSGLEVLSTVDDRCFMILVADIPRDKTVDFSLRLREFVGHYYTSELGRPGVQAVIPSKRGNPTVN